MPQLDTRPEGNMAEEEIYDHLVKNGIHMGANPWGNAEFVDPTPEDIQKQINNVVRSISNAKSEDASGTIPGGLETMIDHFLSPILPWEQLLSRWMSELAKTKHTWRRPRRRLMSQGIYLPSKMDAEGALTHLVYLQDVSGSITNQEILRFNSELKYVWDQFKPKRMTVVLFDAIIQKVYEFKHGDEFARIEITGRGGNNMECVANWLDQCDPPATAAIIFSDLLYEPMRPLKHDIPTLWISTGPKDLRPPYGEMIRIPIKSGSMRGIIDPIVGPVERIS
jgi:predicted metal-dependent peptidase